MLWSLDRRRGAVRDVVGASSGTRRTASSNSTFSPGSRCASAFRSNSSGQQFKFDPRGTPCRAQFPTLRVVRRIFFRASGSF